MAERETPSVNESAETKKSSFSASDTLGKIWDAFTQKESTEAQKKTMRDILDKQKKELAKIADAYKEGRSVIVGESGQEKIALLQDMQRTIQNLRIGNNGIGMDDEQQSAMEDSYEKLEAKITGTKETVDFKYPEFVTQAIDNLVQFEASLNAAPVMTPEKAAIPGTEQTGQKEEKPTTEEDSGTIGTRPEEAPVAPTNPAPIETKNSEYTIKKGDTLSKIAKKHGTTVADLMKLNGITDKKSTIYAGKTLNIPAVQDQNNIPSMAINYPPNSKGVQ